MTSKLTVCTTKGQCYKKNVKIALNKSKYNTNNLLFYLNLKNNEKFKNSFISEYENKKKKEPNSTKNSFIQSKILVSTDEILRYYNNFVDEINIHFDTITKYHINAAAYDDSSSYLSNYKNAFNRNTKSDIEELSKCTKEIMKFFKETKQKMQEEFYNLLSLKEDNKTNQYQLGYQKFKSNIQKHELTTRSEMRTCGQKNKGAYNSLYRLIRDEFCTNVECNLMVSIDKKQVKKSNFVYSKVMDEYKEKMLTYTRSNKDVLEQISTFLNSEVVQIIIKENICEKTCRNSLRMLVKKIDDTEKIYKNGIDKENKYYNEFQSDCSRAQTLYLQKEYISNTLIKSLERYEGFVCYNKWNSELKKNFDEDKKQFDSILQNVLEELGKNIVSLVYPENIATESNQIFSKATEIYNRTVNMIREHFIVLENLSYKYSIIEISNIIDELTQLYSDVFNYEISLKDKYRELNMKYKSIEDNKNEVEKIKGTIQLRENKLVDLTYDVLNKKKKIDDIIRSAKNELDTLNEYDQELKTLIGEIDLKKTQVQTKKDKIEELKRQEDEKIKNVIEEIKKYLGKINEKKSNYKTIIDIKESSRKDLNIIKNFKSETFFNDNEYTEKIQEMDGKISSALEELFNNGKLEESFNEISRFLTEKNSLNYEENNMEKLNIILDETQKKISEIENTISNATSIINEKVTPITKNIEELKNEIITKSIEDLYNKINNSFETFNVSINSISGYTNEYEKESKKMKKFEDDITIQKNELLHKNNEKYSNELEEKDISLTALDHEKISEKKKNIEEHINNNRSIISTIEKELELYEKIEKYFTMSKDQTIVSNIKGLKEQICPVDMNNKLKGFQTKLSNTTNIIESSIKNIESYKKIIEGIYILNKIINMSDNCNTSINNLRKNTDSIKKKIDEEDAIISRENKVEENIKNNFLSKIRKKKEDTEDIIRNIDELKKNLTEIIESSINLKEKANGVIILETLEEHLKNVSIQESRFNDITKKIDETRVSIELLNKKVDSAIKGQHDEISNIFHKHIIELYEKIKNDTQTNSKIIKDTEACLQNYDFENDIEKVKKEKNKKNLKDISQSIKNKMEDVNKINKTIIDIQNKSQKLFDESNNEKSRENSSDKKNNIKKIYETMAEILKELEKEITNLGYYLVNIKENKIQYKKESVNYTVDQINDEKEKANKRMEIIDELKKKIIQLKEKTIDISKDELESFNYEIPASKAKENQQKINELVQEANALKEKVSSDNTESGIDNMQIIIETKLRNIIIENNSIDNASYEMENMEKCLMTKRFNSIMDTIRISFTKAKREKEITNEKFTKSEDIKKKIIADFQRAKDLRNVLIEVLDENSVDEKIKEIKLINDDIIVNTGNINEFLTITEQHKENCRMNYHNIERGKYTIEYLKNHDYNEKKEITGSVIEEINKYVKESRDYSDKADKYSIDTRNNYDLCCKYKEDMDDLLNESLILGENIKYKLKVNEINNIWGAIQNDYNNIESLLKKLIGRLNILKKDIIIIEQEKEETNSEKSIKAYGQIQTTKVHSNRLLEELETLKQRTMDNLNGSKSAVELISRENETAEKEISDRLKAEQENLKRSIEILRKVEINKNLMSDELNKLKGIEININDMDNEMKKSKKLYEEGILEEIKKVADKEKENIEFLMKSINATIGNIITFIGELQLEENDLVEKCEDTRKKMNDIYNIFDKSYGNIEKFVLNIIEPTSTYASAKEKREEAELEEEKLKNQKHEMENLLKIINDIKRNEILRLILHMKKDLDKLDEKAKEEHSWIEIQIKDIKGNIENIKDSDSINSALDELNKIKKKSDEINKSKIRYSAYKDEIHAFYSNINKTLSFIDMGIKTISEMKDYESMKNIEDIILRIEENLGDINKKVRENKDILIKAESIYEEVKLREELKKRIKEELNKIDGIFSIIQGALDKYTKIKEINFDDEKCDVFFKIIKESENLKNISNAYMSKLNKMDGVLKLNTIKTELDNKKSSLTDLERRVEATKTDKDEFSSKILRGIKNNIGTITKEIDYEYSNVSEINIFFYELLELGKNYKLSLQYAVSTTVNIEISKDMLIIEKKKKDAALCVQYIKNSCDSMINDINIINKSYKSNIISTYESNNVENANVLSEELKRKGDEGMKTTNDIKKLLLTMNESKDENKVDEYLQKLKDMYEIFQKERININEIFRNINDIKLKEMDKNSEKLIDIAHLHKNIVENQEEKFLNMKKQLSEIRDFLIGREKELLGIVECVDIECMQKINKIDEEVKHKTKEISELENNSSSENNKILIYTEKVSHLIERAKFLLRDIELYEHESDYDLSEKMNNSMLDELDNYIKRIKEKGNKSKELFENYIQKNKDLFLENNNTFLSVHGIIKNINDIIEIYRRKLSGQEEKNKIRDILDETIKKNEHENFSVNDDINKNSQKGEGKQNLTKNIVSNGNKESNENNDSKGKNKTEGKTIKLAHGMLGGLLISCVIVVILYKGKGVENNVDEYVHEEYENGEDLFNSSDREEVIEVNFIEGE
ncbi:reticulocyte binding protein, putative [Plasmodium relictum]|uniref:Reticulocyte binding protein, putative n=1 Tax=Plasmodium relictum TaxID=85471 RepID=A0A1J1GK05_PLARL|nr:reticulocyte binding protein, putative [Plasmodium relictum]CRG84354.1 reticulocyte binding protein, putative [Plasmodium relictum]